MQDSPACSFRPPAQGGAPGLPLASTTMRRPAQPRCRRQDPSRRCRERRATRLPVEPDGLVLGPLRRADGGGQTALRFGARVHCSIRSHATTRFRTFGPSPRACRMRWRWPARTPRAWGRRAAAQKARKGRVSSLGGERTPTLNRPWGRDSLQPARAASLRKRAPPAQA